MHYFTRLAALILLFLCMWLSKGLQAAPVTYAYTGLPYTTLAESPYTADQYLSFEITFDSTFFSGAGDGAFCLSSSANCAAAGVPEYGGAVTASMFDGIHRLDLPAPIYDVQILFASYMPVMWSIGFADDPAAPSLAMSTAYMPGLLMESAQCGPPLCDPVGMGSATALLSPGGTWRSSTVIPEPAASAMLLMGLLGIGACLRNRRVMDN